MSDPTRLRDDNDGEHVGYPAWYDSDNLPSTPHCLPPDLADLDSDPDLSLAVEETPVVNEGVIVTQSVLLFVAVALSLYAFFAPRIWGNDAAISEVCFAAARKYPVIPYVLGFILGHIFWPRN